MNSVQLGDEIRGHGQEHCRAIRVDVTSYREDESRDPSIHIQNSFHSLESEGQSGRGGTSGKGGKGGTDQVTVEMEGILPNHQEVNQLKEQKVVDKKSSEKRQNVVQQLVEN